MEEIVSVPVIVMIVYMIIELLKSLITSEKFMKFIPLISCSIGIILGIVAFFCCPTLFVANNILSAIFVGGVSGLSATGANQVLKQLINKNKEINISKNEPDDETKTKIE